MAKNKVVNSNNQRTVKTGPHQEQKKYFSEQLHESNITQREVNSVNTGDAI